MQEGLARYITAAKLPLTFIEEIIYRSLQRFIQPQFKKMLRNTLKYDFNFF